MKSKQERKKETGPLMKVQDGICIERDEEGR